MTYDNNGNMTSDGVNSYTWDRANRLLTWDNGATADLVKYGYGDEDHHSLSQKLKGLKMAYCYASDWIINKDDLATLTNFVDSAKSHNCELIAVPFETQEGYKGQRFLIYALSQEDASHFMNETREMMRTDKWISIIEEYFQEKLDNEGYPRRSLIKLRYEGTLNMNLSKLFDNWYGFADYNDRLREQSSKK